MEVVIHVAQLELAVHIQKIDTAACGLMRRNTRGHIRIEIIRDVGVLRITPLQQRGGNDVRAWMILRDAFNQQIPAINRGCEGGWSLTGIIGADMQQYHMRVLNRGKPAKNIVVKTIGGIGDFPSANSLMI